LSFSKKLSNHTCAGLVEALVPFGILFTIIMLLSRPEFVTLISGLPSLVINDENVIDMIQAGRSRWKIENENNNILKTKGYHFDKLNAPHFEHNYGHGKPFGKLRASHFLASLLATLIILAFLIHTVLEWMNSQYLLLRQKSPSHRRFFEDIRILTSYLYFDSWDELIHFMLQSFSAHVTPVESS